MPWGVGCDAMLEMSVLIFGTVRCKQFDGDCGGLLRGECGTSGISF